MGKICGVDHNENFGLMLLEAFTTNIIQRNPNFDSKLFKTIRGIFSHDLSRFQDNEFVMIAFDSFLEYLCSKKDMVLNDMGLFRTFKYDSKDSISMSNFLFRKLGFDEKFCKKPYTKTIFSKLFWIFIMFVGREKLGFINEKARAEYLKYIQDLLETATEEQRYFKCNNVTAADLSMLSDFLEYLYVYGQLGIRVSGRNQILELCGLCESGRRFVTGSGESKDTKIRDDVVQIVTNHIRIPRSKRDSSDEYVDTQYQVQKKVKYESSDSFSDQSEN